MMRAPGSFSGPVVGGRSTSAEVSWPWVFCVSLPFSGVRLVCLFFFLFQAALGEERGQNMLARADPVGGVMFAESVTGVLIPVTRGGGNHVSLESLKDVGAPDNGSFECWWGGFVVCEDSPGESGDPAGDSRE
ncbi:hypothetical protein HOY80DRAFT_443949 [Tuber brumale]|nr:hypothetical protein HOY80DRAFT_443949 [Tuber brumale]